MRVVTASAPPLAVSRAPGSWRRHAVTGAAAGAGVLLYHAVSIASGKLEENAGLGWDGVGYAHMVTDGLAQGTITTRARPLLVLAARVPYSLGLDVITSFHLLNYLWAFMLYVAAGLILDRAGARAAVKAIVVANLALCIATSKMFAFYPVQVDLGALALTTLSFHLTLADRRWLAGAACALAAASREFGVVVALCGIHRSLRQRRSVAGTALAFLPAVAVAAAIRWWALATAVTDGPGPVSLESAVENLNLWSSPAFPAAFAYFGVTVFGGVSALLTVRLRWCMDRIRETPELATYLLIVVAMAAAGSLDIWRYLAFALPAVLVLCAACCRDLDADRLWRMLIAMTLVTLLTQRPFEPMTRGEYFRDWFPLYPYFQGEAREIAWRWGVRLSSLVLLLAALYAAARRNWMPERQGA